MTVSPGIEHLVNKHFWDDISDCGEFDLPQ